jgi:hypothetical protein
MHQLMGVGVAAEVLMPLRFVGAVIAWSFCVWCLVE